MNAKPSEQQLLQMLEGCVVEGVRVVPVYVDLAGIDPGSKMRLRIVVNEGRNREVRRLIESVGLECLQLKRVRIGALELPSDLSSGEFRLLKPHEVKRVTDRGAETNIMINKLNRILTSGTEGVEVKVKKFHH